MGAQPSLFDTYGGMAKVSQIILAHYDRVVETPELAPYFEQTDMRALIEHQSHFLASVMGGPSHLSDAELHAAHSGLGIDDAAFDLMLALLRQTLLDFAIAEGHVDMIVDQLGKRRPAIVVR